ncbi:MAG: hypothetical protein WCJ85_05160 [Chitinophagaceae bacterium]
MLKQVKNIFIVTVLISTAMVAMADRGTGKKAKSKTALNLTNTGTNFRNALGLNLLSGLHYTGSLINMPSFTNNKSAINSNSLVTFQKGNTVYIIPFKQKIITPEIGKGYTGMKLIIKSH